MDKQKLNDQLTHEPYERLDELESAESGSSQMTKQANRNASAEKGSFIADIDTIRRRARANIDQGPVTDGYKADRARVISVLNEVLATEIVCTLRYQRHYHTAKGINAQPVADEFLEHAKEEQGHVDRVAQRIIQLQGEPNFNPAGLATRSHSEYVEGNSLTEMIREDLIAERIAIQTYSDIIRWLHEDDPTSRRMMEEILEAEEEHAEDLVSLLAVVGKA